MGSGLEGYIVDSSGNRTAVIIPMEEYESLLKSVHDHSREPETESLLDHRELQATLTREWSD